MMTGSMIDQTRHSNADGKQVVGVQARPDRGENCHCLAIHVKVQHRVKVVHEVTITTFVVPDDDGMRMVVRCCDDYCYWMVNDCLLMNVVSKLEAVRLDRLIVVDGVY